MAMVMKMQYVGRRLRKKHGGQRNRNQIQRKYQGKPEPVKTMEGAPTQLQHKQPAQGQGVLVSNKFAVLEQNKTDTQVVEEQIQELVKEVRIDKGIELTVVLRLQEPTNIP